ncbi:hypothetical protein [Plantibacter sp. CFBP 8804]|uniref:hypothetical protein n=1 Tax=Plantibacter sp. CFBP 8804 TaxID=2775270 RepID=UPI001780653E|nr:hypothetical protein [Plantibacter sp. CFBP 8804]MBD8517080.1 hypothetical protein [Plantibacter sp. CFBP 8804]
MKCAALAAPQNKKPPAPASTGPAAWITKGHNATMGILSLAPDTDKGRCHLFEWCGEPEHESPLFGWYPANAGGAPFRDHTADITSAGCIVVHEAPRDDGSITFAAPVYRRHLEREDLDPASGSPVVPSRAAALAASIVLPASWRLSVIA